MSVAMLSMARGLAASSVGSLMRSKAVTGLGAPCAAAKLSRAFSDDSHDDFQPKTHGSVDGVGASIQKDIASNRVMVYMKGVPEAPMCGFSNTVCKVLEAYGVDFNSRNVLADPELREGIKEFTSWPTIPQVFVDGEFVGGCDIIMSMHQNGELEKLFAADLKKQK